MDQTGKLRVPSGAKAQDFRGSGRHGSFDFAQDKFRRAPPKMIYEIGPSQEGHEELEGPS
jgi:hypothetical protein